MFHPSGIPRERAEAGKRRACLGQSLLNSAVGVGCCDKLPVMTVQSATFDRKWYRFVLLKNHLVLFDWYWSQQCHDNRHRYVVQMHLAKPASHSSTCNPETTKGSPLSCLFVRSFSLDTARRRSYCSSIQHFGCAPCSAPPFPLLGFVLVRISNLTTIVLVNK